MWIAHIVANTSGGPRDLDPPSLRLPPFAHYDFRTPDGLAGARYWPKLRCDAKGNKCVLGESGGPGMVCAEKIGCAPPVDTKFEASFGGVGGSEDWVDVSLVDGFTLPFKFKMKGGTCHGGFGSRTHFFFADDAFEESCEGPGTRRVYRNPFTGEVFDSSPKVIDCSRLTFHVCPHHDHLGSAANASAGLDLKVRHPGTGQVVGCYSPCSKLTLRQWANDTQGTLVGPADGAAKAFCCPTPPVSPEQCRAGPIKDTRFVRAVHRTCPGVYGFSYDDGMGLLQCSPDTHYEMTFFCPSMRPPVETQPARPWAPATPCIEGAEEMQRSARWMTRTPSATEPSSMTTTSTTKTSTTRQPTTRTSTSISTTRSSTSSTTNSRTSSTTTSRTSSTSTTRTTTSATRFGGFGGHQATTTDARAARRERAARRRKEEQAHTSTVSPLALPAAGAELHRPTALAPRLRVSSKQPWEANAQQSHPSAAIASGVGGTAATATATATTTTTAKVWAILRSGIEGWPQVPGQAKVSGISAAAADATAARQPLLQPRAGSPIVAFFLLIFVAPAVAASLITASVSRRSDPSYEELEHATGLGARPLLLQMPEGSLPSRAEHRQASLCDCTSCRRSSPSTR